MSAYVDGPFAAVAVR